MKATVKTTNPVGFGQIFASPARTFGSVGAVMKALLVAAVTNIAISMSQVLGVGTLRAAAAGSTAPNFSGATAYRELIGTATESTRTAYQWGNLDGGTGTLVVPLPTGPLSIQALFDFLLAQDGIAYVGLDQGTGIVYVADEVPALVNDFSGASEIATFDLQAANTYE